MKSTKKSMSLLLALVLCLSLGLPAVAFASASPVSAPVSALDPDHVIDEITIGETQVFMNQVSDDTDPEDVAALLAAAQSVQLMFDEATQNALVTAMNNIDPQTKADEEQAVLQALINAGQVSAEGTIPAGANVVIERTVHMNVIPKGYKIVDGKKVLVVTIEAEYEVSACVQAANGKKDESVPATISVPLDIVTPFTFQMAMPEGFLSEGANAVAVKNIVAGQEFDFDAPVDGGIVTVNAKGTPDFEFSAK